MNNQERHKVGVCYNEKGHEAAVKLGHKLVSGAKKEKRVNKCVNFVKENPESIIYCARGGMRSEIVQDWIKKYSSKLVPRLKGGYKALRNYMIEQLQPENQTSNIITLGVYTGSGKTILLNKLENSLDLEGLANHRGSGFGNYIDKQPTPINFENNLATQLIKHRESRFEYLIIEHESNHIGRIFISKPLFEYFKNSPLVIMDVPIDKRVEITYKEYVIDSQRNYKNRYGNKNGLKKWFNFILDSFKKVKERLGGVKFKQLTDILKNAYENGKKEKHKKWIKGLLENYYDPMYEHHIEKIKRDVIFRGSYKEVLEFLKSKYEC